MKIKTIVSVILLACPAGFAADSITPFDIKLGQWESTSTTNMSGMAAAIPPDVLQKMPPEQRAKIEERMKAYQGPRVSQNCVKKEDLDKALKFSEDNACTRTLVSSSRSKQEIRIECNRNGSKQTGTLRIEAVSSESIKGAFEMTSTGAHPMNFSTTFTSKWIGPCKDK